MLLDNIPFGNDKRSWDVNRDCSNDLDPLPVVSGRPYFGIPPWSVLGKYRVYGNLTGCIVTKEVMNLWGHNITDLAEIWRNEPAGVR
jgi:hypothetical protein